MIRVRSFAVLGALALVACADIPTTPNAPLTRVRSSAEISAEGTYVILGANGTLPQNLEGAVAAAGGTLSTSYDEIGVAGASSTSPDFAARLRRASGIASVTPDMMVQWTDPTEATALQDGDVTDAAAGFGGNETWLSFQWAPKAIQAPEAWNAGITGQGVRIAIIDGGIYRNHVDLAPNVDVAASRSFVFTTAGVNIPYDQDVGTTWHGTHVAGIAAASSQNCGPAPAACGIVGVAPNATIIGVKALHNGTGSFNAVINAIMYAATPLSEGGAGANIINLSLGAVFDKEDPATKKAVKELKKAVDAATKYAWKRGVTVIAAAGNDGLNFDEGAKDFLATPAMNAHVISVAATGPHGWALGATNFDRPAYYTNIGIAVVDIAAPGGTVGLFVVDGVDQICTVTGEFRTVTNFCEVFDMVLSSVRGSGTSVTTVGWLQGTSMASPMVAGVAALILQKKGPLAPNAVMNRLKGTSIDAGAPGLDPLYGRGWVNAWEAIK
jgi:subtilisin family serine protease